MKKLLLIVFALVCFTTGVFAQAALDPSRLAVGGRSLGLGRAYVGLADDVTSIFLNPAGLYDLPDWQMTSMSGKFAEEFSYLLLTGAYPTRYGVFGFGFVGASTGGVPVTRMQEGTEADPIYVVDTSQQVIDYYNNVYFFSWAKDLPYLLTFKVPWDLRVGTSLKIFNTALSGDSIIDGRGAGNEVDMGLKLSPTPYWGIGATARNVLPFSMGGKLTYPSGYSEYYAATYFLGTSLKVLGKPAKSLFNFHQDLSVLADLELNGGSPNLMHMGVEWTPLPLIALRVGIDQDVSSDLAGNLTVENGMSYGVGLTYAGFRFDYAYHQFPGLPGIDNNYFSLSYGLDKKIIPEDPILISSPSDKSLTFESSTKIIGQVVDPRINALFINGIRIKFDLRGHFETRVDLKEGKNAIKVEGMGGTKVIHSEKVRILRLKVFPDVEPDYWVAQPISLLAMQNIISGYPNGLFKPEGNINRAEMCTLLMKTGGEDREGLPAGTLFPDVVAKHWAAPFITQAAAQGIVKGYPDDTFRPSANITRAEGLAMIVRFAKVPEWAYADEFPDLTYKHWAIKLIAGAKKEGMLKYLEGKAFQAKRKLTRAETVEMLYRTSYVGNLLAKGILDWESY